jgi:hypothetical protein
MKKYEAVNKCIERSEEMNTGIGKKQKCDINGGNNIRNKDGEETVKIRDKFQMYEGTDRITKAPFRKYLYLPLN